MMDIFANLTYGIIEQPNAMQESIWSYSTRRRLCTLNDLIIMVNENCYSTVRLTRLRMGPENPKLSLKFSSCSKDRLVPSHIVLLEGLASPIQTAIVT